MKYIFTVKELAELMLTIGPEEKDESSDLELEIERQLMITDHPKYPEPC